MAQSSGHGGRRMALMRRDDLLAGRAAARTTLGRDVALFHAGARYFALDDACLRCSASLAAGTLDGAKVRCRCGWTYDLATGGVAGVARLGVDAYPVILDGDDVCVTIPRP